MYKVSILNGDKETIIHSPHNDDLKLETGTIKKEINKIDSFNMGFYMNNPAYGKLKPFKTLVKVLNTKTNQYEFEGRVLAPDELMDDTGLYDAAFDCEGELGFLHDSQQKHLEFRGKPSILLKELLTYHNEQVEEYKRFEVGFMEVTTNTDNIYIYLSAEKTTFEEIEDKILKRVGGELHIRKEDGKRYLDVLERVGKEKKTPIKIAKNLRSMSRSVDPTEIITRLTPLGERIESEDEESTDASEARLTIEEVNDGLPYIDDEALIEEFGIQGGSETWDDITQASRLLSTAKNWMNNQKVAHVQYEISALDLFLIGLDIDNFDVGNSHPVINPIMNIDEILRVIGKTIDINSPEDDSLKIGDKFKSLHEYQVDAKKAELKVVELENTVERQSKRLGQVQEEVKNVNQSLEDLANAFNDADVPAIEDAVEDLNEAVDNLTEAVENIEDYEIATENESGLMSKEDKTKLNLIEVISDINLDELKDKLSLISITDSIDLDKLKQDVEELKNE